MIKGRGLSQLSLLHQNQSSIRFPSTCEKIRFRPPNELGNQVNRRKMGDLCPISSLGFEPLGCVSPASLLFFPSLQLNYADVRLFRSDESSAQQERPWTTVNHCQSTPRIPRGRRNRTARPHHRQPDLAQGPRHDRRAWRSVHDQKIAIGSTAAAREPCAGRSSRTGSSRAPDDPRPISRSRRCPNDAARRAACHGRRRRGVFPRSSTARPINDRVRLDHHWHRVADQEWTAASLSIRGRSSTLHRYDRC